MPARSLVHSVRILPETIAPCSPRDWTAQLEVTLNGGSVWQMNWSWFGARDQQPEPDYMEEVVASFLQDRMTRVK